MVITIQIPHSQLANTTIFIPMMGLISEDAGFTRTLPFIEQQALFANFESSNSANGWALLAANKTKVLSTVMCPSDPSSPKTDTLDGNTTTAGVFENKVCIPTMLLALDPPPMAMEKTLTVFSMSNPKPKLLILKMAPQTP